MFSLNLVLPRVGLPLEPFMTSNPAGSSLFQAELQWRGVAEPER